MNILIFGSMIMFFVVGVVVCPMADKNERKRIIHKWRGYR